ncbi:hypothetical protein [Nocardioides sp. W7]|uniref:hypothetical protein n=1 Tax=Nocardioides sp. W7 TaxID=2931390 RepID=UPI001FD37FDB|nr:hypothetical protein [Nocardioides sp. W7]
MRRPTLLRLALGAGALVLVLVSSAFGRAEPTGIYRPLLGPDALTNGCYPLVDGIELDFPYQVRSDGDRPASDGVRRQVVLQWDELDTDELEAALDRSVQAAGYQAVGPLAWAKGEHRIAATVTEVPDLPEDSIVRGRVVLDLPATPLSSTDPVCADPYSTKRFPAEPREFP